MITKKTSATEFIIPGMEGYHVEARKLEVHFGIFTQQFDLTPTKARALAQALSEAADESERLAALSGTACKD